MHNADEESVGAAATLVADPEISRSQDSRSMLAIPAGTEEREGGGAGEVQRRHRD